MEAPMSNVKSVSTVKTSAVKADPKAAGLGAKGLSYNKA
jgi:hypothetical protein